METAPIHANPNRLVVPAGQLDHGGELLVALHAAADVAGVDSILGQSLRACRVVGEQLVPVEMEVTHQRNRATEAIEARSDGRGSS